MRKAERLRANPDQPLTLLVSGAPGTGRTSLLSTVSLQHRRACVAEVAALGMGKPLTQHAITQSMPIVRPMGHVGSAANKLDDTVGRADCM